MELNQFRKIIEAIDECRSAIMFTTQSELEASPNWQHVRSRILRAFGDKGLKARIAEILKEQSNERPW